MYPRLKIEGLLLCLASLSVFTVGCQTSESTRKAQNAPKPNPIHREIRGELFDLSRKVASTSPVVIPKPEAEKAVDTMPSPTLPAPRAEPAAPKSAKEITKVLPPKKQVSHPVKSLPSYEPSEPLKRLDLLDASRLELSKSTETPLIFDIPVTYNERVRFWIRFFQTGGRTTFKNWLERSARYLPIIQYELSEAGLPQDLVYVPMIESGFVSHALSHAGAKGMWQFIAPTAERYGLKIDWWIDERQDFLKATRAAIRYMTDLYRQFGSWYLVAASYNMGENGVRRLIKRHGTTNFWELADRRALPQETRDYVPKIIASILISKAPALYGFRDLEYQMPLSYETVMVPGGTDIVNLASYLGVSEKYLKGLNPELLKGFIPSEIQSHEIRVPKGSVTAVAQFVRLQSRSSETATAAN